MRRLEGMTEADAPPQERYTEGDAILLSAADELRRRGNEGLAWATKPADRELARKVAKDLGALESRLRKLASAH